MVAGGKYRIKWKVVRRSLSNSFDTRNDLSKVVDCAKVILRDVKNKKHSKNLRKRSHSEKPRVDLKRETSFVLSPTRVEHTTVTLEEKETKPARLMYDLNRILYQPLTLHPLKDYRSGVYNFRPEVEVIPPSNLEPKERFKFITPYKDASLFKLARKFRQRYVSSTSSMTSTLSHLHFLLSNFRPLNLINTPISKNFPQTKCNFTKGARFPATIILRKLDNDVISLDSDRSLDREIMLSTLGSSLEEFLTDKDNDNNQESYHFSKIDEFILRSQLDAFDPKLPGTGVFDLKTRAVAAIRHDISYVEMNDNFTGYEIDRIHGEFESLEREFYDLIKSTLLKYSLQAKIGKMDGIFVAYHNISKMFGFQYLPLDEINYIIHSNYNRGFQGEMNRRNKMLQKIHGSDEYILEYEREDREIAKAVADSEFKMSILLLRNILVHIENTLKLNGINSWDKLKIMMKTETQTEYSNESRGNKKVPILRIVVLPLPSDYKDEKLMVKGIKNGEIMDQIEFTKTENKKTLETQKASIIGFEVKVDHFYKHHPETTSLPSFAKPENNILDLDSCQYISQKYNENYYNKLGSFDHPSFFHPKDVSTWKVNCHFTNIVNKERLVTLYEKYLDEKLKSLKEQCAIKESLAESNSSAAIIKRIKKLVMGGSNTKEAVGKRKLNQTKENIQRPTAFQSQLRAYALKSQVKSELLNKIETNSESSHIEKITWDA